MRLWFCDQARLSPDGLQLALFAPTRVNRSWIAPRSEKATDCDYHIHRASACPSRAAFHANGTTKTPSKANAASIAHASLTLQTKAAARAEAQHIVSTGVRVGAASARVKVSNLRKRFAPSRVHQVTTTPQSHLRHF
jgi:hypothetical protein